MQRVPLTYGVVLLLLGAGLAWWGATSFCDCPNSPPGHPAASCMECGDILTGTLVVGLILVVIGVGAIWWGATKPSPPIPRANVPRSP